MNEKLEKLNRQLAQGAARLRRAQNEEKILEHQMKQLTRKERTHRLCTRGAMLESFLIRPEVLTDDDVMEILKQAGERELTSGRGPTGVAAAAIYISSILSGERRTQREVADVAGVTEVTIRNRYKELAEQLDIEIIL